ncbi:MAG: class I SAM-dependent methyltransferase [Chitinophagales bacterium]
MHPALFRLFSLLRYKWQSKSVYYIHSPFVYAFFEKVLRSSAKNELWPAIQQLRKQTGDNRTVIPPVDYGAGTGKERTVATIGSKTAIPEKYGQLLSCATHYFQPKNILELGTSLGFSTAYLAAGAPLANVITIEGNPHLSALAQQHFRQLQLSQIEVVTGNFDALLPELLPEKQFDLVFVDGNHRFEPTVRYFEWLLSSTHDQSVLIFDDIYWSEEMRDAWQYIKKHPRTRLTISVWRMGFVFFRSENLATEHFELRY